MNPPIKIVCSNCGSENVTRDALARWSVPDQRWEVAGELDCTQCEDCDEGANLVEVPYEPQLTNAENTPLPLP